METVSIERNTKETRISLSLKIDGVGESSIDTSVPFLDHMINQISQHGFFDVKIKAVGDTAIDFHHTVEDCGIALGQAFKAALGDKKGLARFGHASIPLNEALASVSVDCSGRPFFVFKGDIPKGKIGDFDAELIEEFLQAFANSAGLTLHVKVEHGTNLHHIAEAVFKSLARALDAATRREPRSVGVPSTKGVL
ncbi:MAG: imidazoleglycerol-phosphate dehydratase HisB [Nitrospinae bacterium]|nr:imidazoleglycerol-phosphate dehydratase HisB [Nitrospinota bacterium]